MTSNLKTKSFVTEIDNKFVGTCLLIKDGVAIDMVNTDKHKSRKTVETQLKQIYSAMLINAKIKEEQNENILQ